MPSAPITSPDSAEANSSMPSGGGANSVLPEMHRQLVELRGWLDDDRAGLVDRLADDEVGVHQIADTGVNRIMTTDVRDFSRYRLPDGRTMVREFQAGEVMYSDAQTHVGENVGSTPTRVIMVELKTAMPPRPARD